MTFSCDAPAKLNLCLYLGGVREDGLHELTSLFESISLCDQLTLAATPDEQADRVICPGVDGVNLVQKALARCRERELLDGPPVTIRIEKHTPIAAGLGGGSADAAAALRLVAHMYDRPIAEFHDLAFELGADVPSQLRPGTTLVQGAGELLVPVDPRCLAEADRHYVIVAQSEGLSTGDVFAQADRLELPRADLAGDASELVEVLTAGLRFEGLCAHVGNDFTPAILSLRPELQLVIDALRQAGATAATFTGSGPTCFGVFAGADDARAAAAHLCAQGHEARAASPVDANAGRPRRVKDSAAGGARQ